MKNLLRSQLIKLATFALLFMAIYWLTKSWLTALAISVPIRGMFSSGFAPNVRHKELVILMILMVITIFVAVYLYYFNDEIPTYLLTIYHVLNLIIDKLNQWIEAFFGQSYLPYFITSPQDNPFLWFGIFWLYSTWLVKIVLKYTFFFVHEDAGLFLADWAYVRHEDSWKVKLDWKFQHTILLCFVFLLLLVFIGLHWQTFYRPYLESWLTDKWLLLAPTLFIPIFIQWYLWLGGIDDKYYLSGFASNASTVDEVNAILSKLWQQYRTDFASLWRKAGSRVPGASAAADNSSQIQSILENELKQSRGLIIQTYPNPQVLSVMQRLIHDTIDKGNQVVVLYDNASCHRYSPRDWEVFFQYSSITKQAAEGSILTVGLFMDKLANRQQQDWISRLGLILIPQAEQMFERPYVWKLMAHAVRDHAAIQDITTLQSVLLAEPRKNLDTSVRNILTFYASSKQDKQQMWREYTVPILANEQLWWTIWGAENYPKSNSQYIQGLAANYRGAAIGSAVPLAQYSGKHLKNNIKNVLLYHHSYAEIENAETLQRSGGYEKCWFDYDKRPVWRIIDELAQAPAVITAELLANGNPWRTLATISQALTQPSVCNIVIKQQMLSEFFIKNYQVFATMPWRLLSPNLYDDAPQDTALQILRRIEIAGELPLSKIAEALLSTRSHTSLSKDDTFEQLYTLIENNLGKHFADRLRLLLVPHWYKGLSHLQFEQMAVVRLTDGILPSANLDWLREFRVLAEDDTLLETIRKDHVQQHYWAGKVIAIDGKKFIVSEIDDQQAIVKVNHNEMRAMPDYRCQKIVKLIEAVSSKTIRREENILGRHFSAQRWVAQYSVKTEKIASSSSAWLEKDAHIITLNQTQQLCRHYQQKKILRLLHHDKAGNSLLSAGAAIALAAWLNEAISSVMPEIAPYFIALAQVPDDALVTSSLAQIIIPQWQDNGETPAQIGLWIVEDSHTDMGIIQAIEQNYWYLLNLCYSWLEWYFSDQATESAASVYSNDAQQLHRDWFTYGEDERDSAIDLESLYHFLQDYMTYFQQKEQSSHSGDNNFIRQDLTINITCDFCRKEITNDPYHTLNDGRITCQSCQAIAVNDSEIIRNYYHKLIKPYFANRFNVVDFDNIHIELTDQRMIAARSGQHFTPSINFDERPIGLTIHGDIYDAQTKHKKNDYYTILLESGFSAEETLATLVHELCYFWQFQYLDIGKLSTDGGEQLRQGHALLIEMDFLQSQTKRTYKGLKKQRFRNLVIKTNQQQASEEIAAKGCRLLSQQTDGQSSFEWLLNHYRK